MKPATKHQNQQTVILSDFSGGLNTSVTDELITEKQLWKVANMEIDENNGVLRTVKGTTELFDFTDAEVAFKAMAYDVINKVVLLFGRDRSIRAYFLKENTTRTIGTLEGDSEIVTTPWEDGLLIASGGYLQYARFPEGDTTKLYTDYFVGTINEGEDVPKVCKGVFVRSGRVLTFDAEDTLLYSGVGDETNWTQDTNDPSASLFVQIGYKVGGKIIGIINLSTDLLIIKDNGMVFRLRNEYPDWQISELGRNIYCKGPAAFCALGNAVLMAGSTSLQQIQTTQDYGDMRPQEMGGQVRNEIKSLSPDVKVRFLPAIHQVWFIDDSQYVLVFDVSTSVFTERYFNSEVVDALCVDSKVFIAKRERLCLLNESDEFEDEGKALVARAHFKTDAALRDQLIKSVALSITPLTSFYNDVKGCALHVSRVTMPFPKRRATKDGRRMQKTGLSVAVKEPQSTPGFDGDDEVFLNYEAVTPGRSVLYKKRQICRDEAIRVSLEATGFPFYLNFISYDKVEV